jgi:hypothetical protein
VPQKGGRKGGREEEEGKEEGREEELHVPHRLTIEGLVSS